MRLSSDDGALDHDLGFDGCLAYGGGLGCRDVRLADVECDLGA